MKVNIKGQETQEQELTFPVLMCKPVKDRTLITLFTSLRGGVCLVDSDNSCNIGVYEEDWIEATNERCWKKYEGAIELSND